MHMSSYTDYLLGKLIVVCVIAAIAGVIAALRGK